MQKTNVMRILEQNRIPYEPHSYPHGATPPDGLQVAAALGREPGQVFKTLVARGASKSCCVFVIPVDCELDLKKAAAAAGEKSVAMLHLSELTPTTGYVRGGCSPIGMKKRFPTFFDDSARQWETILVSAGKIGFQVELAPDALVTMTGGCYAPLKCED